MDILLRNFIDNVFMLIKECMQPAVAWFKFVPDWALISGSVAKVADYLGIFGIGLALVYFLMELNQKVALEGRDMNMKSFFAPFLKLMIAFAVMSQSGRIVGLIIAFNDKLLAATAGFFEEGVGAGFYNEGLRDQLVQESEGASFFMIIFAVLCLLISFVVGNVCKIIWAWKALMYKLEMLFRVSLLPVAVADAYNGNNSATIRYIKGFLALVFYGMSCILLPRIAGDLVLAEFTGVSNIGEGILGFITGILMQFAAPFAAIAASSAAKQIAKEALGC